MGLFSGIKLNPTKGYGGDPLIQLLKSAAKDFNSPDTEGLSDAERSALADQKVVEDARKRRQLESQQRRTRIALGSEGGSRALLYGGYTGAAAAPAVRQGDPTIAVTPGTPGAGGGVVAPVPGAAPAVTGPNPAQRRYTDSRRSVIV